jgi:hypothetical protein
MNAKRPWMLSTAHRAQTGRRSAVTAAELDLSSADIGVRGRREVSRL